MYVYQCPKCPARVAIQLLDRDRERIPECVVCQYTMARVEETAKALLPIDGPYIPPGHPTIGPAKVETLKAAGILIPETQHALDWLWRHRAGNGFAEAFKLVGGRRCVDLVAFARIVREKQA